MPKNNGDNKPKIVVIRRGGGGGGGHHGGAWKIAYADFVTAMMAFFLVMWLINATTEQRRRGIANFFNPMATEGSASAQTLSDPGSATAASSGDVQNSDQKNTGNGGGSQSQTSGNATAEPQNTLPRGIAPGRGGVASPSGGFGPDVGAVQGENVAGAGKDRQQTGTIRAPSPSFADRSIGMVALATPDVPRIVPVGGQKNGSASSVGDGTDAAHQEQHDLMQEAAAMRQAVGQDSGDGADAASAQQMKIDVVPQGLRIQLSASDHEPMFDNASARLNSRAEHLMSLITPYLISMPQKLSIYGYTDEASFRKATLSNWTLSAQRADSARSVLTKNGFPEARLLEVAGRADRDPVVPDDPGAAANRRVVLILHRDHEILLPPENTPAQQPQPAGGTQAPVPVLPAARAGSPV